MLGLPVMSHQKLLGNILEGEEECKGDLSALRVGRSSRLSCDKVISAKLLKKL